MKTTCSCKHAQQAKPTNIMNNIQNNGVTEHKFNRSLRSLFSLFHDHSHHPCTLALAIICTMHGWKVRSVQQTLFKHRFHFSAAATPDAVYRCVQHRHYNLCIHMPFLVVAPRGDMYNNCFSSSITTLTSEHPVHWPLLKGKRQDLGTLCYITAKHRTALAPATNIPSNGPAARGCLDQHHCTHPKSQSPGSMRPGPVAGS